MSSYDITSHGPIQQFVDRGGNKREIYEVVRTFIISGKDWENYRLEIVKRYLEAEAHPSYYYTVFAYVEDLFEVKRTFEEDNEVTGKIKIWTHWSTFPTIREGEADAALNEALKYMSQRLG